MIVLVLLVIINENVILNEVIEELNESIGGAEDQRSKNWIPEKKKWWQCCQLWRKINIWQDWNESYLKDTLLLKPIKRSQMHKNASSRSMALSVNIISCIASIYCSRRPFNEFTSLTVESLSIVFWILYKSQSNPANQIVNKQLIFRKCKQKRFTEVAST